MELSVNLAVKMYKEKFTLEEAINVQVWKYKCSFTLSLTSALEAVGWSTPRLGCTIPGNDPVHNVNWLGGTQSRYGRVWKISPPPGFDLRATQPVASRYTD